MFIGYLKTGREGGGSSEPPEPPLDLPLPLACADALLRLVCTFVVDMQPNRIKSENVICSFAANISSGLRDCKFKPNTLLTKKY